ncbi:MAG: heme exporter protein CcmD [Alphaproteobacteria bacterium]|nr:heme exporter protein CcmD [Alphaproteobacteria bacterium]
MATYFEMGGYAWFVWPAYAFSAAIMVGLVVTSLTALRRDRKILDALEAANPRRAMRREAAAAATANSEEATSDA